MGFPTDQSIQQFVQGKTIEHMEVWDEINISTIVLRFTNGEAFKISTMARIPERPKCLTITTPFKSDETCMQSDLTKMNILGNTK